MSRDPEGSPGITPSPPTTDLQHLAARLSALPGLQAKADIRRPAATFPHLPFPELGPAAALGDDAALLPAQEGGLLLACEGMHPQLVEEDPWFAGWCGVLVNLSDIAAMGGRPLAVVNSLWCRDPARAEPLLAGMLRASDTFGVPVVGGHTNLQSPYDALSVAVLGVAGPRLLPARQARPGDRCWLLIDGAGRFRRPYPFWDAATDADPLRLRRQLALLPELAATGWAHAAKDISMGGLIGTAAMFCEASGCGLALDLDAIEPPAGEALEEWLTCFPSFGFLLATAPGLGPPPELAACPGLLCAEIGAFTAGDSLTLSLGGSGPVPVLRIDEPVTGFTAAATAGSATHRG